MSNKKKLRAVFGNISLCVMHYALCIMRFVPVLSKTIDIMDYVGTRYAYEKKETITTVRWGVLHHPIKL